MDDNIDHISSSIELENVAEGGFFGSKSEVRSTEDFEPDQQINSNLDKITLELLMNNKYLSKSEPKKYEESQNFEEILQKNGNLDWIRSLPHIIERDEFILVHGGLHPDF